MKTNVDERLKRMADFVDETQPVLAPTKNKTITVWVRIRTKDFGMSAFGQSVIGATLAECVVKLEEALTAHYNDVMGVRLTSFENVIEHSARYDESALREELEGRYTNLRAELTELQEALNRMKKRETHRNRRNRKAEKDESTNTNTDEQQAKQ